MASQRRFLPWALCLAVSGVVVLGTGLVGLYEAARGARKAVVVEAQRSAAELARSLRVALREPRLLALLPRERRFRLVGGKLLSGSYLGWLEAPLTPILALAVPGRVRELVWRAEEGAKEGRELFAEALKEPGLDRAARRWVLAAEGWWDERHGHAKQRDAVLHKLARRCVGDLPATLVSLGLLHQQARADLPAWFQGALVRLPPLFAEGFLERYTGSPLAGRPLAQALRAAWRQACRDRRLLQEAATRSARRLAQARAPLTERLEDQIFYFVPTRRGEGQGALLDPARVVKLLLHKGADVGLTLAGSGKVVTGSSLPGDALPGGPFIGILPNVPGGRPLWTRGWVLWSLLAVLGCSFLGGLLLLLLAVRRETEAVRVKGDFLTSVSHELRTPLASIRLMLDMLDSGRVQEREQIAQYLGRLLGEVARLSMLIENVLDLGRLERGERAYDRRLEDLDRVAQEALELFAPLAQEAGLLVAADLEGAGARARVDKSALLQALLNLLENARKYALEGGRVELATSRRNGFWLLKIRDFGAGVALSEREKIFERFERGRAHQESCIPGVGLGLHLSRRLLQDQGGDLLLGTLPAGEPGAVFVVRLHLAEGA